MAAPSETARGRLTSAIAKHLIERGSSEFSLRELGGALGSSHRMLRYHFKDRDGILAAVAEHLELRMHESFVAAASIEDADPREVLWWTYEALTDPAQLQATRLCFELWGRQLGRPGANTVLFAAWLPPLTTFAESLGFKGEEAATEARLLLATAHGVMLDVLTTGERGAVDAMVRAFIARYPDGSASEWRGALGRVPTG